MERPRRRLGWIGPTILIAGLAIGGAGVWYWRYAMPVAGEVIDQIPCPSAGGDGATIVVRAEQGGDRSFVELHATSPASGDYTVWQALIPHYAGTRGRPAVACGPHSVTVRVERGGRAEVFGFLLENGDKLGAFRIATEHEPIRTQPTGPITLTDHVRSYELVGGADWHQVVAVDLTSGQGKWKVDLGPAPVTDAGVDGSQIWVRQGDHVRRLDSATGRDAIVTRAVN